MGLRSCVGALFGGELRRQTPSEAICLENAGERLSGNATTAYRLSLRPPIRACADRSTEVKRRPMRGTGKALPICRLLTDSS